VATIFSTPARAAWRIFWRESAAASVVTAQVLIGAPSVRFLPGSNGSRWCRGKFSRDYL